MPSVRWRANKNLERSTEDRTSFALLLSQYTQLRASRKLNVIVKIKQELNTLQNA